VKYVTIHADAHRHDVCQIVYFMFSDLAFKHSRLSDVTFEGCYTEVICDSIWSVDN